VRFRLLGDVEVRRDDGSAAPVVGAQPRAVLAVLVAAGGQDVPTGALVDGVWSGSPPPSATSSLYAHLSRLRRMLGPLAPLLRRSAAGYRLDADPADFDFLEFEQLADAGRAALDAGDAGRARQLLCAAEQLWRGPVLGDLAHRAFAQGLVARLDQRRHEALTDRIDADLQLGRHRALLPELAALVRASPLDEMRWAQLALASYRAGSQAGALAALTSARRLLRDELGVDPGPALRSLETRVLHQDPTLDLSPESPATAAAAARLATRLAEAAVLADELGLDAVAGRVEAASRCLRSELALPLVSAPRPRRPEAPAGPRSR
jgi:DNA-binding SARP family transcriptional activator